MTTRTAILGGALALLASAGLAQTQPVQTAAPPALPLQGFESENAILDTSIPFASGAREARQELRGSFGWSTFQEGQVQGVYYRFDPDGYARFSSTPRLDTDVFEVICRPRTLTCMGRKGGMTMTLTPAGQIQLGLESAVVGDRFFLSEGLSEVPLPDRVVQPLDGQLEALLSTGGELVVRRGDQDAQRHSLSGFFPVAAYLRWISARQDYAALPRDWPVPNSATLTGQASPQLLAPPQPVSPGYAAQVPTAQSALPQGVRGAGVTTEVAEVRGELNMLRRMLLDQNAAQAPAAAPGQMPASAAQVPMGAPQTSQMLAGAPPSRLDELEQSNKMLMHELQRLRRMSALGTNAAPAPEVHVMQGHAPLPSAGHHTAGSPDIHGDTAHMSASVAQQTAERLEYLMTEIGLDAKTALLLIQSNQENAQIQESTASGGSAYQDALVTDILAELQDQMPALETADGDSGAQTSDPLAQVSQDEFVLLSEYFRSVMQQP